MTGFPKANPATPPMSIPFPVLLVVDDRLVEEQLGSPRHSAAASRREKHRFSIRLSIPNFIGSSISSLVPGRISGLLPGAKASCNDSETSNNEETGEPNRINWSEWRVLENSELGFGWIDVAGGAAADGVSLGDLKHIFF